MLKDWPSGYKFYDHHKGPSNGNIRHDLYLVGKELELGERNLCRLMFHTR